MEFEKLNKVIDTKDKEIDYKIENIYRDMDSRNDKLYEKIMKNKHPLLYKDIINRNV